MHNYWEIYWSRKEILALFMFPFFLRVYSKNSSEQDKIVYLSPLKPSHMSIVNIRSLKMNILCKHNGQRSNDIHCLSLKSSHSGTKSMDP